MSLPQDGFKNNLKLHLDENPAIKGLQNFRRKLEKDYFSNVLVRNCSSDSEERKLVIEMECQLELVEMLYHMQNGTWGTSPSKGNGVTLSSPFAKALWKLQKKNQLPVEVEELALFLKDTAIVIKKIHPHSIEQHLGSILSHIAEHYVHFTRGLDETPFEIYIPVFEEDLLTQEKSLTDNITRNPENKNYFRYWGLYFDSEEDAVIYELSSRSFISGDLHMLNH